MIKDNSGIFLNADQLLLSLLLYPLQRQYDNQSLFIDPILPGGIELIRKWNQEYIVTNKGYDAVFRASRNITFVLETT